MLFSPFIAVSSKIQQLDVFSYTYYLIACTIPLNYEAWQILLGREIQDPECTKEFLLSWYGQGENSFENRPVGAGNLLLDVAKKGEQILVGNLSLEGIPQGLAQTIALKQVLNLISNGAMILMNKVVGNRMIDVRAANNKLIDRCIRLIKEIKGDAIQYSDKEIYHLLANLSAMQKTYQEKGTYTPSLVKIFLTMVSLNKTPAHFAEIVDHLAKNQESI